MAGSRVYVAMGVCALGFTEEKRRMPKYVSEGGTVLRGQKGPQDKGGWGWQWRPWKEDLWAHSS